jgi:hypothetical protein
MSSLSSVDGTAGLDGVAGIDQGLCRVAGNRPEGAGLGREMGQPVVMGYKYLHFLLFGRKGPPVVTQPQPLGYKYIHQLLSGYKGPPARA